MKTKRYQERAFLKTLSVFLITGLLLASLANSFPSTREVIVNVKTPSLVWNESKVDSKIKLNLTRTQDIRIKLASELGDNAPAFPDDYYNLDSLINWGAEVGGKFLMLVDISSERLEKRKSFHLPLVFHKYETYGVIEGELRIVDLLRSKLLVAEPFKVEEKGPRVFQATMDDDINDPDLKLSSPDKIIFFDKLEDKLTQHLIKRTRRVIGNR